MKIIRGRGRHRLTELELPCSQIVNRSPKSEQRAVVSLVCDILGISQDRPATIGHNSGDTEVLI